eukprot:jgi/Botrbrau1/2233/Bobra.101_2s0061.1
MVFITHEFTSPKERGFPNQPERHEASSTDDGGTPRKAGDSISTQNYVLDIPPSSTMDEHDSYPPSGRMDSWSLPNAEKGMRVTFQDITYQVQDRGRGKGKITLLHGVSGWFSPLQMTAVMGPSGSGKSTLLDLLAGRKTIGEMKGEVLFAGATPTKPFLRRYTGYVEQNETLLPELTVREMLLYTAGLSLPRKIGHASKVERVDRLLVALGLEVCQHTLIGDPHVPRYLGRPVQAGQHRCGACERASRPLPG